MRKNNRYKLVIMLVLFISTLFISGNFFANSFGPILKTTGNISLFDKLNGNSTGHAGYSNYPTSAIANEGLPDEVKKALGNDIRYNGHGAFIINGGSNDLNANVASAPYVQNTMDNLGRPGVANALVNKTSRLYADRQDTQNGASDWVPKGYHQRRNLKGTYTFAYNRGHLIGYAIAGSIPGFDASESNQQNIITQTSWSNQAGSDNNTGQNYYEGLVRKAQDQNKTVRYRVTPMYVKDNLVASGVHLEAKSNDLSLQFNVYVPNVQGNIIINYANGNTTIRK